MRGEGTQGVVHAQLPYAQLDEQQQKLLSWNIQRKESSSSRLHRMQCSSIKLVGFILFLPFASALLAQFIVTIGPTFQSYEQPKGHFM